MWRGWYEEAKRETEMAEGARAGVEARARSSLREAGAQISGAVNGTAYRYCCRSWNAGSQTSWRSVRGERPVFCLQSGFGKLD